MPLKPPVLAKRDSGTRSWVRDRIRGTGLSRLSVSERLRQGVNQTTKNAHRHHPKAREAVKPGANLTATTLTRLWTVYVYARRPDHYHDKHARATSREVGVIPAASRLCRARGCVGVSVCVYVLYVCMYMSVHYIHTYIHTDYIPT